MLKIIFCNVSCVSCEGLFHGCYVTAKSRNQALGMSSLLAACKAVGESVKQRHWEHHLPLWPVPVTDRRRGSLDGRSDRREAATYTGSHADRHLHLKADSDTLHQLFGGRKHCLQPCLAH
jgi:hypothetical protein